MFTVYDCSQIFHLPDIIIVWSSGGTDFLKNFLPEPSENVRILGQEVYRYREHACGLVIQKE